MSRAMEITTPLGEDVLLFHRMTANEALGRLSEFQIDLLSTRSDIDLDEIIAKNVTVKLALPDGKTRYFNGYVTRFSQTGTYGRHHLYQATVRPWLWFLTRTSDCRIFQNMTVPDIIQQVFDDHSQLSDVKKELTGTYREYEYCVQYRETDFNFVSRLMEQEGIYYYFKHEEGRHTLVLADSYTAHAPFEGYEEIPFITHEDSSDNDEECISGWDFAREIQPCRYMIDDYDFKKPSVELQVKNKIAREHDLAEYEIYDYPGEYVAASEGDEYVRTRIEELQAQFELANGDTSARGLCSGYLFKLTDYIRSEQNREYLIVSTTQSFELGDYESMGSGGTHYSCSFTVLNSREPFRSQRNTPKPIVQGPQTAVVVGPSGDEIYTDEYGRVKVQFHWDRLGEKNENSSCWMRVSQVHAGKGFGGIDIPRIGEEVIVSCLEGDPDQPIITGRVYNGENKPPTGLPSAGMVSGLKSNSTPGGGGYNEMTMDDTKGSEKITIHGQYNMDSTIENDKTLTVNNNRTSTIAVDDAETVGSKQTVSIGSDQSETIGSKQTVSIGSSQTITVGAARSLTVAASETVNIGSNKSETIAIAKALSIGAAYQVSVGAAMNETIGLIKAEEIGGAKIVAVGGYSSENIAASKSVNAGSNITEKAAGKFSASSGGTMGLSAGGDLSAASKAKVMIEAASELLLKCGGASILLKSGGEIIIKGTDINVEGSGDVGTKAGGKVGIKASGKVGVKAGGDVVIKGSNVKQN